MLMDETLSRSTSTKGPCTMHLSRNTSYLLVLSRADGNIVYRGYIGIGNIFPDSLRRTSKPNVLQGSRRTQRWA